MDNIAQAFSAGFLLGVCFGVLISIVFYLFRNNL